MQITDVRLRKVNSENRMKAVASVTFDNEFVIHDIKVIESQNGLFIAMPSRKNADGEYTLSEKTNGNIYNMSFVYGGRLCFKSCTRILRGRRKQNERNMLQRFFKWSYLQR